MDLHRFLLVAVVFTTVLQCVRCWDAAAHVAETDDDLPKTKYSDAEPKNIKRVSEIENELFQNTDVVVNNNGTCDHEVHMLWTAQVGSSIFATPSIVDLHNDGRKEILVPTYTQYFEALDGVTGEDAAGFPFVHPKLRTHAGVVPVDLDGDGSLEWMIATFTGELVFIGDDGKAVLGRTIKIPPLPVKRDWRKKSMNVNEAAKSIVGKEQFPSNIQGNEIRRKMNVLLQQQREAKKDPLPQPNKDHVVMERHADVLPPAASVAPPSADTAANKSVPSDIGRTLQQLDDSGPLGEGVEGLHYEDRYYGDDDMYDRDDAEHVEDVAGQVPQTIGTDGWLSAEAKASMDLVFHPELFRSIGNVEPEHDPFHMFSMKMTDNTVVVQSDEVAVDAHILSTPVVADMDMDGHLDVILHVSYFFDTQQYMKPENEGILPAGLDTDDYVASALVVLDITTGTIKWQQVLHLTTKHVSHPAYAFSTPFVANINHGTMMDVFVTTTLGFVFAFDGSGRSLQGWPTHFAPILGSPVADDLTGDGRLDLCVGDIKGNVVCMDAAGKELWHSQVSGAVSDSPMLGDVNGDGIVDVVVGTSTGGIYALDGRSGKVLPHFPVLADGPIMAPPLLLNMNVTESKGLHIVVPSFDGFLYIVSGTTGCYELVDLGEKCYAMVLADDMTGNGMMDLVVATVSGTVMVLETKTPYHPLKAWPRRLKSFNGATANEGHVGIFIEHESRVHRDIRGDRFKLLVNIRDDRRSLHQGGALRIYTIIVFAGTHIILGMRRVLDAKSYSLELPCPQQRMYTNLRVVMVSNEGMVYEDNVAVSFNIHFLETVKFLVVVPFLLVCSALWFVRKEHTVKAPKYVYRRGRMFLAEDD